MQEALCNANFLATITTHTDIYTVPIKETNTYRIECYVLNLGYLVFNLFFLLEYMADNYNDLK